MARRAKPRQRPGRFPHRLTVGAVVVVQPVLRCKGFNGQRSTATAIIPHYTTSPLRICAAVTLMSTGLY
jgi:hypothetical protein